MLPGSCLSISIVRISVFVCLLKSQLGISETELRDLISEREKKVEEIQESLEEIQVNLAVHQYAHNNNALWESLGTIFIK